MKINVQAVNFNAKKELLDFIDKKTAKLELFSDKIIGLDVNLRVEAASYDDGKVVDFKLKVPGDEFVIKKSSKSFEESISLCVDSSKRYLKKYKDKA